MFFKNLAQSGSEELRFDAKKLENRVPSAPKMEPKTIQNRCLGKNVARLSRGMRKGRWLATWGDLLGDQVGPKLGLKTAKLQGTKKLILMRVLKSVPIWTSCVSAFFENLGG